MELFQKNYPYKKHLYLFFLVTTVFLFLASCDKKSIPVKSIDESKYLVLIDSVDIDEHWKFAKFIYKSAFELDTIKYVALFKGYRENDTTCTISIYSEDGVFRKNIFIDTISDLLEGELFISFQAVGLNKFFFLTDSKVFCLDSDGNILLYRDLDPFIEEQTKSGIIVQNQSDFILPNGKSLLVNLIEYTRLNRKMSDQERLEKNKILMQKPKMFFVEDIFAENLEYSFVMNDAYVGMLDSADRERIPRLINVHANNVLCVHEYSNKIKRYDSNFDLKQVYTLDLDSLNVGVKPFKVYERGSIHDTIRNRYKESLILYYAYYDDISKKFMASTITGMDQSKKPLPSLFICDSDGELLEQLHSLKNYKGSGVFIQEKNHFYRLTKKNLKIYVYELR
ncbi:hypothetical protein SAMN05216474_0899 [Lishizhenia tianjinensis]|uniref:Uncharacterized protein n=1 Tax=Lishizhenia tianjinensis TaxID=477690 RepID=A0A1I6YHI0_9FLAO|nr:hypothetical protein [Lishizhenia tianjinensis]SFT49832.1 hypothetical protein SAMN05216474_0899 [Lishizhenia tianjinensis]